MSSIEKRSSSKFKFNLKNQVENVHILFLHNAPYLLDYASPGHKPYICEHAPNLLLMPINFVLGQIDIQTVIRHDLEVLSDLLRGAGTSNT